MAMELRVIVGIACLVVCVAAAAVRRPERTTVSMRPSLNDPTNQWMGRTQYYQELGEYPAFDFNGVRFRMNLTGVDEIGLSIAWRREHENLTDAMPHRFRIVVNGTDMTPIPNQIDTSRCPVWTGWGVITYDTFNAVKGLNTSERYIVDLQHITEPNWNQQFTATSAPYKNWVALGSVEIGGINPTFHNVAPPSTSRRIEFIGDSLTAGYCNLCKIFPDADKAKGYELQSFAYSWANLVCESLDAQCHTEAWSGMGLLRNVNQNESVTVPDIFLRSLATDPDSRWNFSHFVPQAVVINLGTNDWAGPTPPSFVSAFVNRYVDFVQNISTVYGGKSTFFLACGPATDKFCPAIDEVLAKVSARGIPAHFLDMRGLVTHETSCCGHPDTRADALMAQVTNAVLESVMGWDPKTKK